jgi:hypothetical protein
MHHELAALGMISVDTAGIFASMVFGSFIALSPAGTVENSAHLGFMISWKTSSVDVSAASPSKIDILIC